MWKIVSMHIERKIKWAGGITPALRALSRQGNTKNGGKI
jgi:hypothetical protein